MASKEASGKSRWRPVRVQRQFVVSGGYCSKGHALETLEVHTKAGNRSFCRVEKNMEWLLKCSAGTSAHKGALRRSRVVEDLKAKLSEASDGACQGSAVAEGLDHPDDPMSQLDPLDESAALQARKRLKYSPKRVANRVFHIEMPPPQGTAPGAASAEGRTVAVLGRSTNQLWIATEDIDWLITCMATEVSLGGVPPVPDDAVASANSEVADLHLRWRYTEKDWEATFVGGKLNGKTFVSSVANLTPQKWASIRSEDAVDYTKATFLERKEATRLFLQKHCAKALQEADA